MITGSRSPWANLHFAATVFISAFLLFQVQPLISKYILPWFGGSPAVWTTCLLFFQTLLFAGYAYAHFSEHYLRRSWQCGVHLALIAAALLVLPIAPSDWWKPVGSDNPTGRILVLLTACIGLPYFVLASTGPLVQAWFSRAFPGRSPYRLYALSNIGSLLALLSYPFALEPALGVNAQARWWSAAFAFFCLLYGYAALRIRKVQSEVVPDADPAEQIVPPSAVQRLSWLLYPALASMMLMATTNHVCQDVAVIPFLWVVPLSLYLVSFIITFDHPRWYWRGTFGVATLAALWLAAGIDNTEHWPTLRWLSQYIASLGVGFDVNYREQLVVHFAALFLLCMVCHGELVRQRPAPRYLTGFYLMISLGGALGGLFVSLIAPRLFVTYFEWKIGLVAGFVIAGAVAFGGAVWRLAGGPKSWSFQSLAAAVIAGLGLWEITQVLQTHEKPHVATRERTRSFYGTVAVKDRDIDRVFAHDVAMYNGNILHGVQFVHPDQQRWATTYYSEESGVGKTLEFYQRLDRMRVGVVGLGAGTLATYAERGDTMRFYEINPEVPRLAETHFTYLADARTRGAQIEIVLGDARLSMQRELLETNEKYDVLVLDAFSGDAIPNHLLTVEAFEIYLQHLTPGGAIAVHVSNLYLDLPVVIYGMAAQLGIPALRIESPNNPQYAYYHANWLVLSENIDLRDDLRKAAVNPLKEKLPDRLPVWTDQRHNLFEILR